MKISKVLLPTIVVLALLAVCAVSFVVFLPANTAEAAVSSAESGKTYYIHIPTSEEYLATLAADDNATATPAVSDIVINDIASGGEYHFALLTGYYYKATFTGASGGGIFYLDCLGLPGGFYILDSALDSSMIVEADRATAAYAPDITLTPLPSSDFWTTEATVFQGNMSDWVFGFVGYTDASAEQIMFAATNKSTSANVWRTAPASAFQPFTVPLHADDAARLEDLRAAQVPEGDGTITPPDLGSDGIRVALIIGMAVPVGIIALLLFKP